MSLEPPARAHRCLEIPEILELIFNSLDNITQQEDRDGKAATFCALAITCRAFHDPAAQVLWRDLGSLRAIVGMFPDDAWRIDGDSDSGEVALYPSALFEGKAEIALRRLQLYTRHVRSITCDPFWWTFSENSVTYHLILIHYSALHAMYHHSAFPATLFPNLKDVRLPVSNDHPLETIFIPALVFSSSVKSLTVVTDESMTRGVIEGYDTPEDVTGRVWAAVANRVADIAPQFTSFRVVLSKTTQVHAHWAGAIPALVDTLTHFSLLTFLDITPLLISRPTIRGHYAARYDPMGSISLSRPDII
ncbi:hypothetical protein BKA70DRAFT_1452898 [Coprinopsis sp. MPI-PUGE-AT-0042]|nr:hypothetical protein BKA70DRAFT_1452898 [Coprinopsis sp. MPI-PUGE-AT-0042]